jgi:hypothetical protein
MTSILFRRGLLLLMFCGACVGDIAGQLGDETTRDPAVGDATRPAPGRPGELAPGGGAGGAVAAPGGSPAPGQTPAGAAPAPAAGASTAGRPVVRLLSRTELANTLEDLFGVTVGEAELPYAGVVVGAFASPPSDFVGSTDFEKLERVTERVADQLVAKHQGGAGRCPETGDATACVTGVLQAQGRRIFRRPLSTAEVSSYLKLYEAERARKGNVAGLSLALTGMLQSPFFLYRTELGEDTASGLRRLTDWEYASAISFVVTRSAPDDALLDAAGGGALRTPEGVRAQVRRLLGSKRGREGVLDFYARWLNFQRWDDVEKDSKLFSAFTANFKQAAMRELTEAVGREVLSDKGSLRGLLTTSQGFVDARLAAVYGVKAPATPGLVDLDPATRVGVLTQIAFLANTSKDSDTDLFHAGSLVFKQLLCQPFPPPPDNALEVAFTPDPSLSRRQNLERHTTANATCAACHQVLNPVAMTFDAYDPIGKHRTTIDGRPIDTRGELTVTKDANGPFADLPELMKRLAGSSQVSACHVKHWLQYALGREATEADAPSIERAQAAFAAGQLGVLDMLGELFISDAFVLRRKS